MIEDSIAVQVLKIWGASVESVATSKKQESDWFATLSGFRLLIEEKTKLEDPSLTTERDKQLKTNSVFSSTTPLSPNNRISGIIKKAASQLTSTGADLAHDARIVWFTSTGFDAEAKYYQTINTLYGTTKVFVPGAGLPMRECYFFHHSAFYRFRDELDGAIIGFINGQTVTIRLCLNPYAKRWKALRDSPFANNLQSAPVDPIAEEASGEALLVDSDIDRNQHSAVLEFIRQKYNNERLFNMDMNMASAIVAVPHER
ncbi:MAG: hypothetical protein KA902_04750 [Arenimonas sp.]|nr:hypothetical protein [Arenimonas sp.]